MPYNFYRLTSNELLRENLNNEVNLLFFGRISTYKGVDILVEAFNKVKQKYSNIKLIIAGKGDLSFLNNINLDKVEIRNYFIEQDEMSFLFTNADLLICPYKDATQSGVLMTARAFGLDHLVSNVGGLTENSTCPDLVFDIADNEQLTNKIIEYIEAKGETKFNRNDSLVNISLRNSYLLKALYESLVC
jgi:glycosyltransferase involved in cell wall biosynthesis